MIQSELILIHGLFAADRSSLANVHEQRTQAFSEHAASLGVHSYEWVDGRRRALANKLLRRMRGTAQAVDAVEIIALDEKALRVSLASDEGRDLWRRTASCDPSKLDAARSFVLMGAPIRLLEGSGDGQRVLWFGNGLAELDAAQFVSHYTTRHGPLVAAHAREIGLRNYRQVPGDQGELCESLRELGMGQAPAPAVFAELVMGTPPLNPASLMARRAANRKITTDEKRHIDFQRSMLLLTS